MLRTIIAVTLALASPSVLAQTQPQTIFKCTDSAGNIEYRNSTCPSGTKSAALDMKVATGKMLEIHRSDERRDIDGKTPDERTPARTASEPVNKLPPPVEEKK